ncbi:PAS domain-containing protein [Spirochaeta africana]|uniref:histidine kinase n=1 Tax=Spirochaeta africana (strain ATCC 700263 / DSM 8902 / Z-7692) TaxID=889378 RepID=H9UL23_SPIAZ|nr:PAS domain-containing protein [Spirochaeta africana]AFG38216.1 PAS domain S-box [Spirochaeta africana DSM 8902]
MKALSSALDGKTILLVEDEVILAQAQQSLLEKHGAVVLTACTGETAINTAADHPHIDLVLMDIQLGAGMDGTEAARQILAQRELPLIFVSSHTEPEVVERTEQITSYGYVVKGSSSTVLLAAIRMAFRLFATRQSQADAIRRLEHSQQLLRYIVENTRSAVAVHDTELHYIYVSRKYLEAFRVTEQQVIGKHHYEVFPDIPEKWREVHRRALAGEVLGATDDPFERLDGSIDWTTWECRPWYQYDGSIGGIVVYTEVVNERKQAELRLRASEENLRITLDSIGDGVIATDQHGCVQRMNPVAEQLCGMPIEQARNRPLEEVFRIISSVTREPSPNPVQRVLETGRIVGLANHTALLSHKGSEYHIADSAAPIRDADGSIVGVVLVFRDVTEEYEAAAERSRMLREREMLLKETHHRIKNNMSTVYNLLLLQADEQDDTDAGEVLQNAAGRVYSMMLLYDKLYRSERYAQVSFQDFLDPLVQEILEQFADSRRIQAEVHAEAVELTARQASSLGIILNELVTNSVKHAFEPYEHGRIRVSLVCSGQNARLQYSDNGRGLPSLDAVAQSDSFGMELVRMQAEQCGGQLTILDSSGSDSGAVFQVEFPLG